MRVQKWNGWGLNSLTESYLHERAIFFLIFLTKKKLNMDNKDVVSNRLERTWKPVLSTPEVSRTNSYEISIWMGTVSHFYNDRQI